MLLIFNRLFYLGSHYFFGFLLFDLENFSESSSSDLLNDLVALFQNFLASGEAAAH